VISIFYHILFFNKNINAVFIHVTQKRIIYKCKEDLTFVTAALITTTLRLYGSIRGYTAAIRECEFAHYAVYGTSGHYNDHLSQKDKIS